MNTATRLALSETIINWHRDSRTFPPIAKHLSHATWCRIECPDKVVKAKGAPATPQLLHGPPGLGRDTLFCLLVGVAPAEVALPWALLRFSAVLSARASSCASSSVTGRTASPVSLLTRARQYKLRSANCSECSEPLLVLGLSTHNMCAFTHSVAVDRDSWLNMLVPEDIAAALG